MKRLAGQTRWAAAAAAGALLLSLVSGCAAGGYELRRLAENVSSVEWMYGWNCLLYTDRDGILWAMEPNGTGAELTAGICLPA